MADLGAYTVLFGIVATALSSAWLLLAIILPVGTKLLFRSSDKIKWKPAVIAFLVSIGVIIVGLLILLVTCTVTMQPFARD